MELLAQLFQLLAIIGGFQGSPRFRQREALRPFVEYRPEEGEVPIN